jgi:hypothetical protein
MYRFLFTLVIAMQFAFTMAQTGPAGIGNSSTNPIWYDASQLGLSNGNDVFTWTDISGNGNNASHVNRPRFFTNIVNDTLPAINFNGINEYFTLPDLSALSAGEAFLVLKLDNDPAASAQSGLWDMGTYNNGTLFPYTNGNIYEEFGSNTRKDNIPVGDLARWGIYNASSAPGTWMNFLNGNRLDSLGNTVAFDATPILGANENGSRLFDGYMAEFILFDFALNSAQRIILNNYLSSKYGIAIANDKYIMDVYYGNEVAGIGREDALNMHTSAQSAGILQISAPSDLNDGEYLLFGHDNMGVSSWSANEIPVGASNIQRIQREWRFDATGGDVGTLTVDINSVNLPALPADYNTYYLLIDADGDFTTGASMTMLNSSGQVSGVTIPDGYFVTVAIVKPIVEFTLISSNVFENAGTVNIEVSLNYACDEDVTIDFTDALSTATNGGTDYDFTVASPLIISSGSLFENIQVIITDDAESAEGDETVVIDLDASPANAILGDNNQYTLIINDNDGTRIIDFQTLTASGAESVSSYTAVVEMSSSYTSDVTVDYEVTGGNATEDIDFTIAAGTVTILSGATTGSFDITINQDALNEADETIEITLSNPSPVGADAIIGTDNIFTYTITNDDSEPNVSFASSSSSVSESAGMGSIQVMLSSISGQDVVVDYSVADGSATGNGTDYSLSSPGSVTIPAGELTAYIYPFIVEDDIAELSETFTLTITGASGAAHVEPLNHTFTISDNEDPGFVGPGGVGDENTNFLWWDANSLGLTDGANVFTWTDRSGNNHHGSHVNKPRFEQNTDFNGHPAIDFNGINEYFTVGNLSTFTEGEIFIITERDEDPPSVASKSGLWGFGTSSNTHVPYTNGNVYDEFGTNSRKDNFPIDAMNQSRIYHVVSQTNNWKAWLDDTEIYSTASNTVSFSTSATVGANSAGNVLYNGLIAEVILFNQGLNTTQRNIVNNYLSSKYDIPITNDYYTLDANHYHDVAGIGYESSSDYHLSAQSADILRIGGASDWDNGEYVFFGHDGGDISAWTSTEAPDPATGIVRLAREWRLDQYNGNAGSFTVTIDTTTLPSRPADFTTYVLMIDNDGNFSSGAEIYALKDIRNGLFQVTDVAINDQYFIAIGAIKPQIAFADTTSQIKEQQSPAEIEIQLYYALNNSARVDYTVTGGTATGSGTDYILSAGSVSIPAGATSTKIAATIVNDSQIETDETIEIKLSNPSSGLFIGADTTHILTINDDDNTRKIDFNAITASGDESAGIVAVQIDISEIDATNPVTVDYSITGGTGSSGIDAVASGTATIDPGNSSTTFDLTINEDALSEADETIIISLTNPSANASLADNNTEYTYTIVDNDAEPDVAWSSIIFSGSETVGSASIEIALSAVSGSDVTVEYQVANGTATGSGIDFTLEDGTATIPSGSTSTTIIVLISEDQDVEGGEDFTVTLLNPIGATLGVDSETTFIISDNDQAGYTGPGGVGDYNTNYLWWDASYITDKLDGANIFSWTDRSGNDHHGVHANKPRYETTTNFNGHPAIDFNGVNEYFTVGNLSTLTAGEIFIVSERDLDPGTTSTKTGFYDFGTAGNTHIPWTNGNAYDEFGTTSRKDNFPIAPMNQPRIYNVISETDNWVSRLDGSIVLEKTTNTVGFSTNATVGANSGGSYLYEGMMAEVIFYQQGLNNAQRIIVQNYLSSKYDITILDDKYNFDLLHGNDVAGIGRVGDDRHTAAMSSNVLRISSATSLDDGDFALFGHDNADTTTWVSTETPNAGENIERIAREWRLDATNDIGTVTVSIDASHLPGLNTGFTEYMIMLDVDGDFTSGVTYYPLSNTIGSTYEASGIQIPDQSYITIAVVKPVIQFTSISSQANEPSSPATLTIELNYPLSNDVTIDYSSAGTATGEGVDYTFPDATATITAGNTSASLNITIINDTDVESDETIIVTLANAGGGASLGANTVHTFTINDDDNPRKISFRDASSSGDESVTPVSIVIEITAADVTNPTTVDYSITGGTALNGVDVSCSGTATIAAGDTETTIDIIVNEDALAEGDETVEITLTNPTNSNLAAANTVFTYTIIDNDAAPDVQFSNATFYGSETSGIGYIEVELTAISGEDVSVDYTIADVSATGGGVDYTLADGTVTIEAGNESALITVVVSEDVEIEGGESFEITLINPTSGTITGTNPATFIISDNDQNGFEGPGGVGDQSTVYFWYDISRMPVQGENSNLFSLTDYSGNNHHASHVNKPRYVTITNFNGKPAAEFNGINEYYNIGNLSALSAGEIFIVGERDEDPGASSSETGLWDFGTASNSHVPWTNGNAYEEFGTNSRKDNFAIPPMDQPRIYNVYSATNAWEAKLDGTSLKSDPTNTVAFTSVARIGANSGANYFYKGQMTEVFLFKTTLNEAQRIIVQNYLAAKFDISIANDYYLFETGHPEDVAGIGYYDASNFHSAAQSAGILKISSPSDLNSAGEYVLFGHDNGDITTWTSTETPNAGENIQRLAREWRMDETGDIGTVTFTVDSTLLPARPDQYTTYVLMVDADGNFSTGATMYPLSQTNENFEATGIDVPDQMFIAIGIVKPTVEFTVSSSQKNEPSSPGSMTIELNYPLLNNVTVDYTVSGTASPNVDYILEAGTISIVAGNTTALLNATIINDIEIESDETIVVKLSNPSWNVSIGEDTTHTLSINDDDNLRKIKFSSPTSSGDESVTPATIQVEINNPDATNPTTVDYAVTGGTATGGGPDYTLTSGTVTIPAGIESTGSFDIIINEDALAESDETIEITLSNPTNCNLDATDFVHTYTIIDNDNDPTISFSLSNGAAQEDVGTGSITVELSSVSGQDVTCTYSVTANTATANSDYILADGTLTIIAGEIYGYIQPVIVEDALVEGSENFSVTLLVPSGATLGAITEHVFNIGDNDNGGYVGPGGVGDQNNMYFWYDVSAMSGYSNGDDVFTLTDFSGNAHNASHANKPRYSETTNFNGKPAIDFNGINEYYNIGNLSSLAEGEIYVVFERDEDPIADVSKTGFWDFGTAGNTHFPYTNGNAYDEFGTTGRKDNFAIDRVNEPRMYNARSASGEWVSKLDASEVYNTASNTARFTTTAKFGTNENQSLYFDGKMAEIFLFTQTLNVTKRTIIEHYLAAKYDLGFGTSKYTMRASYGEGVAGIGKEAADDFHDAAMSDKILRISSPSDLEVGEYLLFGHNAGDITTWTAAEAPNSGNNIRRLERQWVMDLTGGDGSVGNVTFTIDADELPVLPAGYNGYTILIDQDGDFSADAVQYPMEASSGSEYEVNNVVIGDIYYITIATTRNEIDFATTSSGIFEPNGPGQVNIELSAQRAIASTVDYTISASSTASGDGVDYTLSNGTVTIPAGSTIGVISIPTINDIEVENDETIVLVLSNPSTGLVLGANTTHTFNIQDDDNLRKINFDVASASGSEGSSPVSVQININLEDDVNPTTVQYTVTGGTATGGGIDYTLANGTATIPAGGGTSTLFNMAVIDDALYENPDETIIIELSSPTNCNLAATNLTYTYTIVENDAAPTVQFTNTSTSVGEGTSPAQIEVSINTIIGSDVIVDYTVTPGTATQDVDFSLVNGSVTIPEGSTRSYINAAILEDALAEPDENFTINITGATGASVGANTANTVIISDNDADGYVGPGGIGDANSIFSWFDATDISGIADEVGIDTWEDQSGNSNDADRITRPTYETTTSFNGHPAVEFNGTNQHFRLSNMAGLDAAEVFIVLAIDNDPPALAQSGLWDIGSANNDALFPYTNGNIYENFGSTNRKDNIAAPDLTSPRLYNIGTASGNYYICMDADTLKSLTSNTVGFKTTPYLGRSYSGNYLDGQIAEMVVYKKILNKVQKKIINNYFASKYGLTLTEGDIYSFDAGYGEDVSGIGRIDVNTFHSKAQSDSLFTVSAPSALSDGDYLLFGHNNGSLNSWTSGTGVEQINRTWRFQETDGGNGDGVGTITVTLDTALVGDHFTNYQIWKLYVDSDGDFSTVDHSYTMSHASGSLYQAVGVDISDGDYVTFVVAENRTNSSGDFNNAANWSTGEVPATGETATITTGHAMYLSQNTTIGQLVVETGGVLDLNGYTLSLDAGSISLEGTASINMSNSNSHITYSANADQHIASNGANFLNYNNITLTGSGTKTLRGDINVDGNIYVAGGITLDVSATNYNIDLSGNWSNNGTFAYRQGSVTFDAPTGNQTIGGSGVHDFYNLIVDKVTSGDILLTSGVNVEGTLTLTSGDVVLNGSDLVLGSNAIVAGTPGASSYIQADGTGFLYKQLSDGAGDIAAFELPIGDLTDYTPFTFDLNSGTRSSASVSVKVTEGKHGNYTLDEAYVNRYFTMEAGGITGTIDYDVSLTYLPGEVTGVVDSLQIGKFSGGAWTYAGSCAAGVCSATDFTSFSDFFPSDPTAGGPLPIVLIEFNAYMINENDAKIVWKTLTETNNDYFTIEKSSDGVVFYPVDNINGAGNSQTPINYQYVDEYVEVGTTYYRLRQTDFDGTSTLSNIVSVNKEADFVKETSVKVYPNPVEYNLLNIIIDNGEGNRVQKIEIYDVMGYFVEALDPSAQNHYQVITSKYAKGVYFINIITEKERITKRVIVK